MFRFPWMHAILLCSWNQTSKSSLLCISSSSGHPVDGLALSLDPSSTFLNSHLHWFFIISPLGCSQCLGGGLPALDGSAVQSLWVTAFWKIVLLVQSCGYGQLHKRSFLWLYQIKHAFLLITLGLAENLFQNIFLIVYLNSTAFLYILYVKLIYGFLLNIPFRYQILEKMEK